MYCLFFLTIIVYACSNCLFIYKFEVINVGISPVHVHVSLRSDKSCIQIYILKCFIFCIVFEILTILNYQTGRLMLRRGNMVIKHDPRNFLFKCVGYFIIMQFSIGQMLLCNFYLYTLLCQRVYLVNISYLFVKHYLKAVHDSNDSLYIQVNYVWIWVIV